VATDASTDWHIVREIHRACTRADHAPAKCTKVFSYTTNENAISLDSRGSIDHPLKENREGLILVAYAHAGEGVIDWSRLTELERDVAFLQVHEHLFGGFGAVDRTPDRYLAPWVRKTLKRTRETAKDLTKKVKRG
jgi:hypothetical protein